MMILSCIVLNELLKSYWLVVLGPRIIELRGFADEGAVN